VKSVIQICSTYFVSFLYSLAAVAAQETKLAERSMQCAAYLSLFAQAHEIGTERGRQLARAKDIFMDVYLKEVGHKSSADSQGAARLRRSEIVQELRVDWVSRASALREQGVICGAWAEGLLEQGNQYQYVPVYPKVVPLPIRTKYQEIFDRVRNP
jgi:hypothetical protein